MFLEQKSSISELFLKNHVTLIHEDWINDAKNADLITEIHFDNIQIEKSYSKFHAITVFTVFLY